MRVWMRYRMHTSLVNRPKAQQAHQDHCHYPGDAGSKCIKTMTSSLEDS